MGFWYSRNAKLLFRCRFDGYGSSSNYYGYAYNGENFTATNGQTGKYLFATSAESTLSNAQMGIRSRVWYMLTVPEGFNQPEVYVCMDNQVFDDNKYTYSGEITSLTVTRTASYPGSTIFNISNSTSQPVTFNAIEWTTNMYISDSSTNRGTSLRILTRAYVCDSPVTLAPGQTYTIEFTV